MKRTKVSTEMTVEGNAYQFDEAEAIKLADAKGKKLRVKGNICSFNINFKHEGGSEQILVFKDKEYVFYVGDHYTLNGFKLKDKDWIVSVMLDTKVYSPKEFKKKFKVIK